MNTDIQDDNTITCDQCGSSNIENISDENIYATGLYLNMGFIGGIDKVYNNYQYRCIDCGYEW